ncbi:hypothetical protein P280DRAFT_523183 [Massarina eburnea CBS 473.64]|uniref:C2H2-type domain-containing protein n=1 Tax=Massarina eburnea CBS 473.64 TaxID=1395130 RepID=A0A6A6RJM9_9PLEO|nr:hypothetical protein P280DRAFT_523183 [Massarina eburnea CBS 473.64]
MSTPGRHPRRRPQKASTSPLPTHAMSLRKGHTFSSPNSVQSELCNLANEPLMPRRSPTSTESLEELLNDSDRLRTARLNKFLQNFDSTLKSASPSTTSILNDPEVLPVPSFILDNARLESTPMDIDSNPAQQHASHDHASDSGLGSSVGSKSGCSSAGDSIRSNITSAHAVVGSFTAVNTHEEKHTLGERATQLIKELIVQPILDEESLKDFHPLIRDVPTRIGEKKICNLRDLEKTLVFLAPEFSTTAASYERFCERTIHLLQVTVDQLSEPDQKLPSDRPYTSNYFLDLIEQIRRYAQIMATTRRKEENGEPLDEMDYSRDETLKLGGAISYNGQNMHLVREKDGKTIPVIGGFEGTHRSAKRALSDDEMDVDEATRSMARRRKSEKPGDVIHRCRDCKKEFKRPCDLTKHEKTHTRPWKCTEQKCKYFELGWPTEKERDRHVNDKHSADPRKFKCLFQPCPYASKRDSNCKQHMEKAHEWEYVRSKNNGKSKKKARAGAKDPSGPAPPTPLTPFLDTPQSAALSTPITPFNPSPSVPMVENCEYPYGIGTPLLIAGEYQDDFRRDSIATDGSNFTYSSGHSPNEPTSFDDAVTPEDTAINHNDVFGSCLNTNFNSAFQQPTPAMSTGYSFDALDFPMSSVPNDVPHLSPSGQADMTLFSPQMHIDEGFGDSMDIAFSRPSGDFTLFQSSPNDMTLGNANFFPEISHYGGQFDSSMYVEPTTKLDDLMGFDFNPLQ